MIFQSAATLLDDLMDSTLRALKGNLRERVPLPQRHRVGRGNWSDEKVTLETEIWLGRGSFGRLHLSRGRGAMESLTIIALPRPDAARPVFAVDLVAFRDRIVVACVDQMPLGVMGEPLLHAPLDKDRAELGATPAPPLLDGLASSEVLFARRLSPRKHGGPLKRVFEGHLRGFVATLEADAPPCPQGSRAQRHLLRTLGENKREARAMAKLFGDEWAESFLRTCFFSDEHPSRPSVPSRTLAPERTNVPLC